MALTDKFVSKFKQASTDDNTQFMSGEIDHDEYWGRVHGRDAQVKEMSPDERAQVNG
ncbi:MAG: hypothetical protein ACRDZY_00195 [Acidimicrobiales bacterium]